jgi:hypothetical protein
MGCHLLSRLRRFGKSLLLGALREILSGDRRLFEGLWIDSSDYDFKKRPVVHLVMNGDCQTEEALKRTIIDALEESAWESEIDDVARGTPGGVLRESVNRLNRRSGERAAILIDEYDAPICGVIGDSKKAETNRQIFYSFYSVLKSLADKGKARLIFVTGVTKFTRNSIFHVFNNLADLTLNPGYNAICALADDEFETYFPEYLPRVLAYDVSEGLIATDATLEDLKNMILGYYDGYCWDGKTRVLNPYSLIILLAEKSLNLTGFPPSPRLFFWTACSGATAD